MLKQSKAGGGGVLPANHTPRGEKTLKVVLCHQLLPLCLASCSLPWGLAVAMGWLCLGFLDLLWFCGRFLFLASPVFFFCTCLMWEEKKKKKKGFANSTSQVRNCFQAAVCLPQDSSVCSPACWRRAQVIRSAALACVTKPKPMFTSSDCITHARAHK